MNENTIAIWNTYCNTLDRAELTERVPISGSSSSSSSSSADAMEAMTKPQGWSRVNSHQTKTWTIDFHPSTTPRSNDH
jgi:hypothetical protein